MNYEDIEALRQDLAGEVVLPGNATYKDLSSVFNRTGAPALIVRCADEGGVSLSLAFADKHELPVSVRSGGHGLNGNATNDGGLVIDFSLMRSVEVLDEERRLVRIQPGATWGEVAQALQVYEMSLSAGDTGTVGVGGLAVGGGIGWMVRKYGLTIDAMVAAEIVMADGTLIRASKDEYPELFWAIRGGGANFGAVTAFEFIAHPEAQVVFGSTYYGMEDARSVLKGWSEYAVKADESLSTILMLLAPAPQQPALILILICYAGEDLEKAKKAIEPLMEFGTPLNHDLSLMPYSQAVPNQGAAHFGSFRALHRTTFLPALSDDVIEGILNHYGKPGAATLQLRALGGAMSHTPVEETAFAHRADPILAVTMKGVRSGDDVEESSRALDEAWEILAANGTGSYVNFSEDQTAAGVGKAYPPETFKKLLEIKRKYDPHNLFKANHNIFSED